MKMGLLLTDNVLKDAAKIHNFHKLEKFKLIDCCAISYKGIDDALMVDSNSLYKINVHNCKDIYISMYCTYKNFRRCWQGKSRSAYNSFLFLKSLKFLTKKFIQL